MLKTLTVLIEQHVDTEDDMLILDAFRQNDIKHVCQAIRDVKTADVVYQHVTLRFGSRGEQSVYRFELSEGMRFALDLYSLYLALRQSRFQIDTFHPSLLNHIVVPIDANALLWRKGHEALQQMLALDKRAFRFVIPSLQIQMPEKSHPQLVSLIARMRAHAGALWFDISIPCQQLEFMRKHLPDRVKLAISLDSKTDRHALLPVVRFLRTHKMPWVAGRVASQGELSQYRLLGATHYFGYFSDIPVSMSFKPLTDQELLGLEPEFTE
nr:EAL domain-containing protein [Grimontia marina]